ncbi:MAG TPA: hypothetical protein DCM87_07805 [Planctomycetes bacterium]|nr:hypothetical protein [Planctomycetota bacterium]
MAEIAWTEAQRRAIEVAGGDVAVSAGAGAGKTAVLTARVLRHVRSGVPIDRLLIITFTDSAARELKTRVAEELRKCIAAEGGAHLRPQSLLLGRSWISTIHSFCLRVLKEHGLAAGLSARARVQQRDEAELLAEETAQDIAGELLARDAHTQALVGDYCDGNVREYVALVRRVAALADSLPDAGEWLAAQRARASAGEFPADEMRAHLESEVDRAIAQARESGRFVRGLPAALAPYAAYIEGIADAAAALRARHGDFEGLRAALAALEFGRLPSPRVGDDLAHDRKRAARAVTDARDMFKKAVLTKLAAQTEEQYRRGEQIVAGPGAALLDAAIRFRAEVRRRRAAIELLSFNDLERLALELLGGGGQAGEEIAAKLREHFVEVLVDEFQDVNPLQDRLLGLAARGNLFCVGDLKQSIYRFRLGEPAIFAERIRAARAAGPGRWVPLQENFRCRAGLIRVINGIFEYLMTDALDGIGFDAAAELRAGRAEPVADSTFGAPFAALHVLPDRAAEEDEDGEQDGGGDMERAEREAHVAARELVRLRRAGLTVGAERRPLAWRDCAILLRAVKGRTAAYTRVFADAGIPVAGPSSGDPFEQLELRDLLALTAVLDNPRQDIPLAAVMRSPFGGFGVEDLAAVRAAGGDAERFHALVLDGGADGAGLGARLAEFRAKLGRWRRYARELPLGDALGRIIAESGYMAYVASLPRAARRRAHVIGFLERARQFSTFAAQGLRRFVRFLEDLREQDRELGAAAVEESAQDAVRIASIHQSKGLEWPVVVAADMGRQFNLRDLSARVVCDRALGIGLRAPDAAAGVHYPTARHLLVCARKKRELLAEEMRLLYVAFTRARERLIIIGSGDPDALGAHFDRPDEGTRIPDHALHHGARPLAWVCRALGRLAANPEIGGAGLVTREFHERVPPIERADAAAETPEAAGPDPVIERMRRILLHRYEHEEDTRRRASFTATELGARAGGAAAAPPREGPAPARVPVPEFMQRRDAIEGRERGLLAHLFLRHMDLRARDLGAEFERLAGEGVFEPGHRDGIDADALRWFLGTPEGARWAEEPERVRREVPFFARVDTPGSPVLLRGRIDAVRCGDDGLEILDFKTDRVDAREAPARAESYAPQLMAYSWALQAIWQRPVAAAAFVFLSARAIVPVPECRAPLPELARRIEALIAERAASPAAG